MANTEPAGVTPMEDLNGTAALLEIAAMGRVAALSLGGTLLRARVAQLERDADRARRRGDPDRARALLEQAKRHDAERSRLADQTARETLRARVADPAMAQIQGRLTRDGRGVSGLRVDLVAKKGGVLDTDASDAFGAFLLRNPNGTSPQERIVVSDGKGGIIRIEPSPLLGPGRVAYLELALDGYGSRATGPAPTTEDMDRLVEVPDVTGRMLKEARTILRRAKLAAEAQTEPAAGVAEGTVLRQTPAAGASVEPGTEVLLVVAEGGGDPMPDLRGTTLEDLPARLKEARLSLGPVTLDLAPDAVGRVVGHVPVPGDPVAPEAAVAVRIGTGEPKVDVATAALLLSRDPRADEMGITPDRIAEAFEAGKVKDAESLRSFADQPASRIGKAFRVTERPEQARLKALVGEIAARFPKG